MKSEKKLLQEGADHVEFITSLRPVLVAFFSRRCGNTPEAEDLAQDVLVNALKHAHWSSIEEAKGYIFKIAANRWLDRGRRRRVRQLETEWIEDQVESVAEGISLERTLSSQEELKIILAAIEEMQGRTREIFVLCRLEKMRQIEVAELLGVSISTVERHLVQAIQYLTKRMDVVSGISDVKQ